MQSDTRGQRGEILSRCKPDSPRFIDARALFLEHDMCHRGSRVSHTSAG